MNYSYYNSEEEFLSAYTAAKLRNGGNPVITSKELNAVRDEFILCDSCSTNILRHIADFNFDDLQKINEKFQKKASVNRPWQKRCFEYKNGKLFPTYAFEDFTYTDYGTFVNFLQNDEHKHFIKVEPIKGNVTKPEIKTYLPDAKRVADYVTEEFAQRYINMEIEKRYWPVHMKDLSSIFQKDLGKVLELPGTKANFHKFHQYAKNSIAILLSQGKGNLILSDKVGGNLAFNNLKRILSITPILEKLCDPYQSKGKNEFNITVNNNEIKVNETKLIDYDPYGNFSNEYSFKERQL